MALTPLPIRLFCDLAARSQVIDLNTSQGALFYRGDDIEVDIGLGENGNLLTSLGNLASVTLQMFQSETDTNPPMMSQTVLAANMNLGLTQSQWSNDTAPFYHAAFIFPNSQTAVNLNGQATVNYWLRITATTTDTPAKIITLLDGPITVKDGPVSAAAVTPLNILFDPVSNAYYGIVINTVGGVRSLGLTDNAVVAPNGYITPQVYDPVTNLFYNLVINTVGGVRSVGLSDAGFA